MAGRDGHLHEVLGGYAKFLHDKNLALDAAWPPSYSSLRLLTHIFADY